MEHLKQAFARDKQGSRPALVTYVTAGFPTPEETPGILLGMQAGGSGEFTKPNPQLRRTDDNIKTSSSLDSLSRTQLRTDQLFKGLIRRRSKMELRYRQCWGWSKTQEEEA